MAIEKILLECSPKTYLCSTTVVGKGSIFPKFADESHGKTQEIAQNTNTINSNSMAWQEEISDLWKVEIIQPPITLQRTNPKTHFPNYIWKEHVIVSYQGNQWVMLKCNKHIDTTQLPSLVRKVQESQNNFFPDLGTTVWYWISPLSLALVSWKLPNRKKWISVKLIRKFGSLTGCSKGNHA